MNNFNTNDCITRISGGCSFKHKLQELIGSITASHSMLGYTPPTCPIKHQWCWSNLSHLHLIPEHLCSLWLLHSFSLQRFPSVLSLSLCHSHFPLRFRAASDLGMKSSLCPAYHGAQHCLPGQHYWGRAGCPDTVIFLSLFKDIIPPAEPAEPACPYRWTTRLP